jgi:hypothetical protein
MKIKLAVHLSMEDALAAVRGFSKPPVVQLLHPPNKPARKNARRPSWKVPPLSADQGLLPMPVLTPAVPSVVPSAAHEPAPAAGDLIPNSKNPVPADTSQTYL